MNKFVDFKMNFKMKLYTNLFVFSNATRHLQLGTSKPWIVWQRCEMQEEEEVTAGK